MEKRGVNCANLVKEALPIRAWDTKVRQLIEMRRRVQLLRYSENRGVGGGGPATVSFSSQGPESCCGSRSHLFYVEEGESLAEARVKGVRTSESQVGEGVYGFSI